MAAFPCSSQRSFSEAYGLSNEVHFDRSGSFLSRIEHIIQPVEVPDVEEGGEFDEEETSFGRNHLTP
jgi:hypothetical protein